MHTTERPVVVIGGPVYSPDTNTTPNSTVRELGRRHPVLYFNSEPHGAILGVLRGRGGELSARQIGRTVFDTIHPRRVEERVWLASVRGPSAIGPIWAPEAMRRHNVRVFAKVIKRWLRDVGGGEPLLIFYWWGLPELTEAVANAASVYDCVDDHAALPGSYAGRERVERLEGLTVDAVDWTYVVSPALLQARARAGRHIAVLPTAVDFRLFGDLERAGFAIPAVLRSAPRPVVGYSGALGNRMDWELLEELTRRRPQWSFVFVGGDPRSVPDTVRRPNVFFTGTMPFRTALAAMSSFDAAIIPVVENRFTAGNSFLKLREYFAHGTPVVAPPLPDPASVAEQAPGLLALARDPDEWMDALTVALEEPSTSPLRAARRAYVEERSIERRTARIVCDALGDDSSSHDTAVSEYIGA